MKMTPVWSNRNSKLIARLINWTLVLVVVFGMFPFAAFALEDHSDEFDDASLSSSESADDTGQLPSSSDVTGGETAESGTEESSGFDIASDNQSSETEDDDNETSGVSSDLGDVDQESQNQDDSEDDDLTSPEEDIQTLEITRNVATYEELVQAIEDVPEDDPAGTSIITLTADIALDDTTLTIPADKDITLIGNHADRKLIGTDYHEIVTVDSDGIVRLGANLTSTHMHEPE
jgi:hypothetical protein